MSPAGAPHAIVNAELMLTFSEPLPSLLWRRVSSKLREAVSELGYKSEATLGSLNVLMPTDPPGAVAGQFSGHGFARMRNATIGTGPEFQLAPNALAFVTPEYAGWPVFLENFSSAFGTAYPDFADAVQLREAALQYVNVFLDTTGPWPDATAPASAILDRGSDLLNAQAFDDLKPWHCNLGWFEAGKGGEDLVQNDTSVSLVDASSNGAPIQSRVVHIRTRQAFRPDLSSDNLDLTSLTAQFERIHKEMKGRLGTLLGREIQNMIRLQK